MSFRKLLKILVVVALSTAAIQKAYAGAPWPPETVSPGNGTTVGSNPPTLCAKNTGDPEGEQVYIKFEVWGGGEGNHQSDWISAGNSGDVVCWTDSGQWTTQLHSWAARAMANNEQSSASPDWGVNIPVPPTPQPECTIDTLSTNPSAQPQQAGTVISVYASASCTNGVASLRFKVDGAEIGTVSGSSGTVSWNTSGAAPTGHTITVEASDNIAGYIKSRSQNYDISSGAPPPTQDVNCSIDSLSVSPGSPQSPGSNIAITGSASCNTGVRAMRIKIGGGVQYELGSPNMSWAWKTTGWAPKTYTITLEAAGQGDNSWTQAASQSTTYRLEAQVPTSVPVVDHFSTGDIIQIGHDVFVIVNGQRRLVPNPDTLDALGITRNWIDNKGFSGTELETISRGSDIPDVNRNRAGFDAFKNAYFPNTAPIKPPTPTPVPTPRPNPTVTVTPRTEIRNPTATKVPVSTPTLQPTSRPTEQTVSNGGFCTDLGEGGKEDDASILDVQAAENPFSPGQCTHFVAEHRPDVFAWIGAPPRPAHVWDDRARANGAKYGVSVDHHPDVGDIVVWERGCGNRKDGYASSAHGHVGLVAYVSTAGKTIRVSEANWERKDPNIQVEPCMSFISQPNVSESSVSSQQSNQSEQSMFMRFVLWLKSLFGK